MTITTLAPANDIVETGWRRGKPIEDPHKMKRWGWITAKPSEHLILVRNGRVSPRSGQGATCFKWPWDAVAIVPTSLQRLSFMADQVTREKVGVQVVGLAVYRIAEPLLAYRVLNFSFPERAQQKLQETLTAMFVGATRRIVATLHAFWPRRSTTVTARMPAPSAAHPRSVTIRRCLAPGAVR